MSAVLVIGAGPVGLTMAAELARYGVPVRIIDKNDSRTDKSKALVIWTRTLELLEQAGAIDPFLSSGNRLIGANMFSGEKRLAHIDLTHVHSRYAFALMLPQSKTEELLEAHLLTQGVRVERRTEALDFKESAGGMEVTLRNANGVVETVRTSWLIGCDGAHSKVRHTMGVGFEGSTLQTDWLLADVHLQGWPIPENELAIFMHAEGVLAAFPISPGRFRVIADIGTTGGSPIPDPDIARVQTLVDRRGPKGVTVSDPIWMSGFRINERKVTDYRKGRAFLVGDAAHVHSPAGGQGMNTGMQDAFNLSWKLALICHGHARPAVLLDSYSVERSAVGKKVLADAGRLTMAATMRNPIAQAARNFAGSLLLGLTPVSDALARNFSEISIGYPQSPLNGPHLRGLGGPAPGERVAPTHVQRLHRPLFALHAAHSDAVDAFLQEFPAVLESEPQPAFGDGGAWLVRPDGYVAAVATADNLQPLSDYLVKELGCASALT